MKCRNCGNNENLINLNLKCLDKGITAYYCSRCGNIQLDLNEQYKKRLIKKLSDKELRKAVKEVIKDAS